MPPLTPQAALIGLLVAPQLIQGLLQTYPPFSSAMARKGYGHDPNLVPPPSELVGQLQKRIIDNTTYTNLMMEAGYSPARAGHMLDNARTYLSALDYITAWRREELSEATLDETLSQQGLTSEDIATLKTVTIYYPTPQDLVRFGVRDVFTSSTISQYGLDEDYPDMLDAVAKKAGLTSEIAHQYWMAHWELPSPTQVYDMVHRGIIAESDAATYLKVADYMPYWRDKLLKLSYDVYTRVDVRRMYALGVLSEAQVTTAYKDLGYDDEKALNLTRFTVLETQHSTESTPSGTVISAYKSGIIDRATAEADLQKSKLSDEAISLMLQQADLAINEELRGLEATAIIAQYRNGVLTKDQVNAELTRIGVPSRLLQLTIAKEMSQTKAAVKGQSKSDLDTWWRTGIIGSTQYSARMQAIGYTSADVRLYLAELRVGEFVGADKKFPWAEYMRDFHDGTISHDQLTADLGLLTVDPAAIAELLDIAKALNG